jgi:Cu+-exporting ATPase
LEFQNDDFQKLTLKIPSIHCSSCIWLLENLYKIKEGVNSSRVNFSRKELTIMFDPKQINLKGIVELLATLGYEPQITLNSAKKNKGVKFDSLITKLGVAGFCFGNIMLLSFPEYFGIESASDKNFVLVFNWLNVLFILPIIFYSGVEYITSAYRSIKQKYLNIDVPITLGIFALFIQSLYEIITETGAGYLDSLAGLIFFLLIGKWFQSKTYENLAFDRDYKSYFPLGIMKLENEKRIPTPIQEVQKGDILLIRNKELIPADCTLISDKANIDYSFVTGESTPESKEKGDILFAGGKQVGSSIQIKVDEEVSQSKLVKLWNQEAFQEKENTSFGFVDGIAKYFTPVILAIATIAAGFWYFNQPEIWVKVFSSVLIVACPCALALASPFTFGSVLRVLGRYKLYLKNAQVVERMVGIQHIVFDKTGTLTNKENSDINYKGHLTEKEEQLVLACTSNSTHVLSQKIFSQLKKESNSLLEVVDFKEIDGLGIQGNVDGSRVQIGSAKFLQLHQEGEINHNASTVYVGIDGQLKGNFSLHQESRQGLGNVISDLGRKYQLSLLSGDNDHSMNDFKNVFPTKSELQFDQSPEDKLHYIKKLQDSNFKTMMVGDGLNDAGALKQSDVGIAITEDIATFTPSSDGILEGKNFHLLPSLLAFVRKSKSVVIGAFIISFLYNIVGLSLAVTGNLEPVYAAILMPLSSITVVAFATISVNLLGRTIR